MILAFQSTQQVFAAFWSGVGALFICIGIYCFFWHKGRTSTTVDRWFQLVTLIIVGIGFIAFGRIALIS
jgi:hypothetical protein